MVINDFEPVTAWACKLKSKQCIGVSHQSSVMHKNAPKPVKKSVFGKLILKYYAPTHKNYGFHFKSLGEDVFTPVIRRDIRALTPEVKNHFTVYLPSYSDEAIIDFLKQFNEVNWEVFSKHNQKPFTYKNIKISPVDKNDFVKSMVSSKGVFCNAGFETPAEALFLKKKLCVIPMIGQYEQQLNAEMLKSMGVQVYSSLNEINVNSFKDWIKNNDIIPVNYYDDTNWIISSILKAHNHNIEESAFT